MQATRGTPLSQPPEQSSPLPHRSRIRLVVLLAAALVVLDQVTKALAVSYLSDRDPIELLGGAVTLRLVRNGGAAFGLAAGFTIVLTLIAVVVSFVIVRMARRLTNLQWAIALGLLLGGAVGNLIDRIFRPPGVFQGRVVDFIDSPVTLVFNLADTAITVAGVFMVLLTLRSVPVEDVRHAHRTDLARDDDAGG